MGNNKAKKRVIMGQWGIIMAQCGSILLIGIPLGQVGVSRVTMAQLGGGSLSVNGAYGLVGGSLRNVYTILRKSKPILFIFQLFWIILFSFKRF